MTVAQLQSIVSLLRSRPGPETPDIGYSRPDAKCEKVDADGVPAEWVAAPGIDSQRAVLYLHGGGYAIGSINTHRRLAYDISAASSARVLLIDYRLAPEHPFPAAVDDAAKAWRWLLQQGFTSDRLAIAGDSAGGGLTIATLVNLRDRKLGLPACAVAISPWIDLEGQGASITTRAAQDPMVQKAGLLWMAGLYLAGKDPRTPLAAPLHADLTGLPPVLVQVGTAETLLDDSTAPAAMSGWPFGRTCCTSFLSSRRSCRRAATAAARSASSSATGCADRSSVIATQMTAAIGWLMEMRQPPPECA